MDACAGFNPFSRPVGKTTVTFKSVHQPSAMSTSAFGAYRYDSVIITMHHVAALAQVPCLSCCTHCMCCTCHALLLFALQEGELWVSAVVEPGTGSSRLLVAGSSGHIYTHDLIANKVNKQVRERWGACSALACSSFPGIL